MSQRPAPRHTPAPETPCFAHCSSDRAFRAARLLPFFVSAQNAPCVYRMGFVQRGSSRRLRPGPSALLALLNTTKLTSDPPLGRSRWGPSTTQLCVQRRACDVFRRKDRGRAVAIPPQTKAPIAGLSRDRRALLEFRFPNYPNRSDLSRLAVTGLRRDASRIRFSDRPRSGP